MDQPIILLILISVASYQVAANCPSVCMCSSSDTELEVNCSSMQLQTIPDDLPENTTALIFSRNSLGAPLLDSDDLQTLVSQPTLVDLRLDSNQIQIILPGAFSNLTAIKRLVLAQNLLQVIPKDALSELPNLEELDLSGNYITTLEDNTFPNERLAIINLGDNRVNWIGQNAFQGLSNLASLILLGNAIEVLSMSSEDLVGLRNLDLSGNLIQVIPNGVFDENRLLERLSLDRNNIGYIDLLTFFNLQNLVDLSLTFNSLNSTVFKLLPLKPNLARLFLYGNKIEKIPRRAFVQNEGLRDVDMSDNCIASIDADAFVGLNRLEILQLAGNKLTAIPEGTFDHFSNGLRICLVDNPWSCDCDIVYLQTSLERLQSICRHVTCSDQGGIRIGDWSPLECLGSTQRSTPTERPTPTEKPTPSQRPTPTPRPTPSQRPTLTERPISEQSPTTTQIPNSAQNPTMVLTGSAPTSLGNTDGMTSGMEGKRGSDSHLVLVLVTIIIVLVITCILILTFCLCFLARKQAIIKRDNKQDIKQNYLDDLFKNSRLSRMSVLWEEGDDGNKRFSIYDKIKEVFSAGDGERESELETYLEPSRPRRRNSYQDHELGGKANTVMMGEVRIDGSYAATLPDRHNWRPIKAPPQQTTEDYCTPQEHAKAKQERDNDNRVASSENDGSMNVANRGTYSEVAEGVDAIQRKPLPVIPGSDIQRAIQIERCMEDSSQANLGNVLHIPLQESPQATKPSSKDRESMSEGYYLVLEEQKMGESQESARTGARRGRGDGEHPTSIYADCQFQDIE